MSDDDVTTSDKPFDRLTALAEQMTKPLEEEGNDDVKAIVFLQDGNSGGIEIFNYEDQNDAMVDLFIHMKAIFQSVGKDLDFIGIPETPKGLDDL